MSHTVLIVDDSKLARLAISKALTTLRPDWTRVEATNAEQAQSLIREHGADLALLDFNMPGMNGMDLAAKLRRDHPTMPIAIITANVQDAIIARAREIGAAFLPKPITEDALRGFLSGAALRVRKIAQ